MKAWHISDTHLSFDGNWTPLKPMHERRWSKGVKTYQNYLDRMVQFSKENISDNDFVFVTGDIVHDMKFGETINSLRWMRQYIKGTIVICRGNHDKYWQPADMRQQVSDLPNFYILDEGEIITIGPYTIGCFSNHAAKTQDFSFVDGRYLETAINTVKQASFKGTTPVMISHYPVNAQAANAIANTGLKAYMSGHIHITDAAKPNGIDWDWYEKSAAQTDDKVIGDCFFSTGTTDVIYIKHNTAFKELVHIEIEDKKKFTPSEEMIILCGLPGSGKSTIAEAIRDRYEFVRVNQDDLGSKKKCIKVAETALREGKSVVIDRCNFDPSQRKTWIDMAKHLKVKSIKVVDLIVDPEVCIARAIERKNHPTLSGEEAVNNVVRKIDKVFVKPTLAEGVDSIVQIRTGSNFFELDIIIDNIFNPEKYR